MAYYARHRWEDELSEIKRLGSLGKNMAQIGKEFGVSRQRMKQVVKKHIPDWHSQYGAVVNKKVRAAKYFQKWGNKQDTDLYSVQRAKFRAKKSNCVRTGYEWTVEFGDFIWPDTCPILGLPLDYFAETIQENSPSFDRIDNDVGYVKGNVQIISWRANRIKNNGTAKEHRQIADFLDTLESVPLPSQG